MKLVIPMAGRGSRFSNRGVMTPKPLVPVLGRPMIHWALESFRDFEPSEVIFIALKDHDESGELSGALAEAVPWPTHVVWLEGVTEGQLCTVLAARDRLETDEDVVVFNTDTIVVSDVARELRERDDSVRGVISVIEKPGEQWSFAKTNDAGDVVRVAEKERISPWASTGMYCFSSGVEFLAHADELIRRDLRVRGEFYVIPVYSLYIESSQRIVVSRAREMWDLGTPEGVELYSKHHSAS